MLGGTGAPRPHPQDFREVYETGIGVSPGGGKTTILVHCPYLQEILGVVVNLTFPILPCVSPATRTRKSRISILRSLSL